jgi:hypothetical protein
MSCPILPRQIESLAWTCSRRRVLRNGGRLLRRNGRMGGTRIRGGRGLLSLLLFLAVAVGVNDVAVIGGMRGVHGWVIYHAQVYFQDYVPCQN